MYSLYIRRNIFIVLEIRTESINDSFVDCDDISKMFNRSALIVESNINDILQTVKKKIGDQSSPNTNDYNDMLNLCRRIMNASRPFNNLLETQKELKDSHTKYNNISVLTDMFYKECKEVLELKKIDVSFDCIEDIYSAVGYNSYKNVCVSLLNRVLCLNDGYLEDIFISLKMISESVSRLRIVSESHNNIFRINRPEDSVNQNLSLEEFIGSDWYSIKYFCKRVGARVIQESDSKNHRFVIWMDIPNSISNGVLLLRSDDLPEDVKTFSNLNLAMSEILPNIIDIDESSTTV